MGVKYTVSLYIPIEQVEALLAETANISLQRNESGQLERGKAQFYEAGQTPPLVGGDLSDKPLAVHLPSGRTAHLPFTSSFLTHPISLAVETEHRWDIATTLIFASEASDTNSFEFEGQSFIQVGNIYLSLYLGKRYAAFYYQAATYSMSCRFYDLPAIHQGFLELLEKAKGVVALLDTESGGYLLLNDLTRQIPFDEWDFRRDPEAIDMESVDLDAFVEAVIAPLDHPSGISE